MIRIDFDLDDLPDSNQHFDESATICHCGLEYKQMRTGLTFADVRAMLWNPSEDRSQWRNKRRRGVLGFWHQLKRQQWLEHLAHCYRSEHADD